MEKFLQNQMKFDKLTQPGLEDAADYFRERDMKYCTSELRVPAVVQLQTIDDPPQHPPTHFAELKESLDIVSGI
jgi:predicted alpha/beta-fold hydrolase